jgi:monofunctional glycosyltransferase
LRSVLKQSGRAAIRAGLLGCAAYAFFVWVSLPDVAFLAEANPEQTVYRSLWTRENPLHDEAEPTWSPPPDLPPLLFKALVHAEDNHFFRHRGVDWHATRKAAIRWLCARPNGGGSTITQQLARNLFLVPNQTPHRKLLEILIAMRLERNLSKQRILELYANVVEYGEGVWGISDAARHYFSAAPDELDPFEIIFLCSLLPAPRQALTGTNLERALRVQGRVASNLLLDGSLSTEAFAAIQERQSRFRDDLEAGSPLSEVLASSPVREKGHSAETIHDPLPHDNAPEWRIVDSRHRECTSNCVSSHGVESEAVGNHGIEAP